MISKLTLLSLALAMPCTPLLHAEDIGEGSSVYELKSGVVATGDSTAEQSPLRFKSGDTALRWRWRSAGGALEFRDAKIGSNAAGGVGFWIHNAAPRPGSLRGELVRKGEVVGSFRIRMDFKGWRPVVVSWREAGFAGGAKPEFFRLVAPSGEGEVFLDGVRFDLAPNQVRAEVMTLPESVVRSADSAAPEPVRPWLAGLAPAGAPTDKERADMAAYAAKLLPPPAKPAGKLPAKELDELRKIFSGYRIRRDGDRVTGVAVTGGSPIAPKSGVAVGEYLQFCERVAAAYARAGTPVVAGELRAMYVDLVAHLLDQGWVAGGEVRAFANYPDIPAGGFLAMREVLAEAGLLRETALSLAWSYGCHEPGDYLTLKPTSSMDGVGYWYNQLPKFLAMLPDERERLAGLRVAKRAYDTFLTGTGTIGPDGATIHHGAFHFAYASYNLPRLVGTITAAQGTEFFIGRPAHERLRTYTRMLSATVSAGWQPYNLGTRAGTPLRADMGKFAASLAVLGSPDGREPYDREMAALAIAQYEELGEPGKAALQKPPLSQWVAEGVKPASFSGFVAVNGGPVAVHRRPGWLVGIAGQSSLTRALEIYGWLQSNNYSRFSRHGSICIMAGGTPPNLADSGWSLDGWDWSRFPGATTLRLGSKELFEGYAMGSNRNPRCGGVALDADGVWGMDADSGTGVTFKKSVFCFDDRITVLTTDIASGATAPAQTTLFQNRIRPGHTLVAAGDGSSMALPAEKTFSGDTASWLLDTEGVGYLLPAGHAPVTVRCGHQQWTYMVKKYLKDPKADPFPTGGEYRKWSRKGKDMAALESHYRPTEGDFATAWFEHGEKPKNASCLYTIVVRADSARLKALSEKPPFTVLRRDSAWHALRDNASGSEAYCVYSAGENTGEGLLRAVNMPVFAMLKRDGSALKVSVASTDVARKEPVKLKLSGHWKVPAENPYSLAADHVGDSTEITVSPEYYQPAVFRLEPTK